MGLRATWGLLGLTASLLVGVLGSCALWRNDEAAGVVRAAPAMADAGRREAGPASAVPTARPTASQWAADSNAAPRPAAHVAPAVANGPAAQAALPSPTSIPPSTADAGLALTALALCPIEVGGGGVKGRVIELSYDAQCNMKVDTLLSIDDNPNPVKDMQGGRLAPDAITRTAASIAMVDGKLKSKYPNCLGLAVGSSGVALASNTADLKQAVAAQGIMDMSFINEAQEARYGFQSSVPSRERAKAILIDLGSSNTKIGYNDAAGIFQSMDIKRGSTSLVREASASGLPFKFGLAKDIMGNVLPKFREDTKTHPEVLKRASVYWIGGAAWATATWSHPELAEKAVVTITRSDLEEFLIALEKDTWKSRKAPAGLAPDAKAAWEKDWASVQKIFERERLVAGVTLMKVMLSDGVDRDKVTFPRYGQWIWGYSVELLKIARTGCSR